MNDKLKEVKETLEDIRNLPNDDNSLMISASTYVEHIEFLLKWLDVYRDIAESCECDN